MSEGEIAPGDLRETIPAELREQDNWVCWAIEVRDGKPTKPPKNPHTGGEAYARSDDPSTWSGFGTAIEACRSNDDLEGIGLMFSANDTLAAVDFDDVRHPDPETGDVTVSEWAGEAIRRLDSYTEVSPSGTGFHTWVFGIKPPGGTKTEVENGEDIEMYDGSDNRFLTVTGDHCTETPETVEHRADVFGELHREHFDADETESGSSGDPTPGVSGDESANTDTGTDLDKYEIIEKARNAKNGDKFAALWDGREWSGLDTNGGQNERDLSLCGILNFWTGNDYAMTDYLFRDSGLMREKWERDDYREATLEKARVSETYDPEYGRTDALDHIDLDSILSGDDSEDGDTDESGNTNADAWRAVCDRLDGKESNGLAYYNGAELLADELPTLTERESGRTLVYDPEAGTYSAKGLPVLRAALRDRLGPATNQNRRREILSQVADISLTPIDDIGGPDGMLCVNNGVLDLSGLADGDNPELVEHDPEYRFLAAASVAYDPDATCPRFERFLAESVDPRDLDTLQELAGYTLMHWGQPFKRAGILIGPTDSGKSTLLDTIGSTLGDENVSSEKLDSLVNSRWGPAQVYGKYANISNEIGSAELEHLDTFNSIVDRSGGISAEFKGKDKFTFAPKAKLLFAANDLPEIDEEVGHSTRDAFFNRLLFVRFPESVPEHEQEKDLHERFVSEEGPGILNWMLEGLARLQIQGVFTHDPPVARKRELWESNGAARIDSVARFKRSDLRTNGDRNRRIPKARAYRYYERYCEREGYAPVSRSKFTSEMEKDSLIDETTIMDPLTHKKRRSFVGTEPAEKSIWIELGEIFSEQKSSAERIRDHMSPDEYAEAVEVFDGDENGEHHITLVDDMDTGETTVLVN